MRSIFVQVLPIRKVVVRKLWLLPIFCMACVNGSVSGSRTASSVSGGSGGGGASGSHIIFVTSTTTNGNIGGLAGADAICAARATAGGLTGTYLAVMATDTVEAHDRFTINTTVKNTNGNKVADNEADMIDGTLDNVPDYDEFGILTGTTHVWTGAYDNLNNTTINCSNWTSAGASGTAPDSGYVMELGSGGTFGSDFHDCNLTYPIYCISTTPQN